MLDHTHFFLLSSDVAGPYASSYSDFSLIYTTGVLIYAVFYYVTTILSTRSFGMLCIVCIYNIYGLIFFFKYEKKYLLLLTFAVLIDFYNLITKSNSQIMAIFKIYSNYFGGCSKKDWASCPREFRTKH